MIYILRFNLNIVVNEEYASEKFPGVLLATHTGKCETFLCDRVLLNPSRVKKKQKTEGRDISSFKKILNGLGIKHKTSELKPHTPFHYTIKCTTPILHISQLIWIMKNNSALQLEISIHNLLYYKVEHLSCSEKSCITENQHCLR